MLFRSMIIHECDALEGAAEALRIGFMAALPRPIKQSVLLDSLDQITSHPQGLQRKSRRITLEMALKSRHIPAKRTGLILIADDNPINQQVVSLHLANLGFESNAVCNGNEAIEALRGQDYSLVFMDCQMPDLDGMEATRLIRQGEAGTGRHVPIVAMTAHAMKGDRDNCIAAGMDDYISKPIDEDALKAVLDRLIPGGDDWPESSHSGALAVTVADESLPSTSPVSEAQVRDTLDRLCTLFGFDRTGKLLQDFLLDSATALDRLRLAIAATDSKEAASAAHYVKGAFALLQAPHMQMLCGQIEDGAKSGNWENVRVTQTVLDKSFAIFQACANAYILDDGDE